MIDDELRRIEREAASDPEAARRLDEMRARLAVHPTGSLTPDLEKALRKAGWTGSPRSIHAAVEALESDGYRVPDAVRAFLAQFVDLSVRRDPGWSGAVKLVDWFDFNAARAAGGIYPERVAWLSERLGKQLVPVGEADCGNSTLLMSPDGFMYSDGGGLCLVGETPPAAIETLWKGSGRRRIELPD